MSKKMAGAVPCKTETLQRRSRQHAGNRISGAVRIGPPFFFPPVHSISDMIHSQSGRVTMLTTVCAAIMAAVVLASPRNCRAKA